MAYGEGQEKAVGALRRKAARALLCVASRAFGGLDPFVTTAEEFTAMIRSDYAKYEKIVTAAGATVD